VTGIEEAGEEVGTIKAWSYLRRKGGRWNGVYISATGASLRFIMQLGGNP
jgi:hypothetical protein